MSARKRRPAWIYDVGGEPDYRFTLANERTLLAWLRTALALIAGGVAVDVLVGGGTDDTARWVARALLVLGALSAGAAWIRWARSERAIRKSEPLPAASGLVLLCAAVMLIGLVVIVTSA